jgi:glycosyltransferase involved in cell wall biosynthesis
MDMQNRFDLHARLLTFYKIPFDFPEDICLDLPLPKGKLAMKWRSYKQARLQKDIRKTKSDVSTHLPYFKPKNAAEKLYLLRREKRNQKKFLEALDKLQAENFDIIHFDGGICFFSDSRLAYKWKSEGKKIVNCYFGDDLRTRGIVKEMDELSDLNLTFEYDHTLRHPNIHFLFFPFDESRIPYIPDEEYAQHEKLQIVHAPTNRFVKGTDSVIKAIQEIKQSRNIEFVLLENMSRGEVIKIKRTCHISVDQIGNRGGTGYGINSLETLSMGIPTVTELAWGMDKWLPESPFLNANENSIAEVLIELIDNKELRMKKRKESRRWVEKHHSYKAVFEKLTELYSQYKILQ